MCLVRGRRKTTDEATSSCKSFPSSLIRSDPLFLVDVEKIHSRAQVPTFGIRIWMVLLSRPPSTASVIRSILESLA